MFSERKYMRVFTSGGRILQMPVFSAMGRILLINPKGSEKSSQLGSKTGHSGGGTNSANADMSVCYRWNSHLNSMWQKTHRVELNSPWLLARFFVLGNFLRVHYDPFKSSMNKSLLGQIIPVATGYHFMAWKEKSALTLKKSGSVFYIIRKQRAGPGQTRESSPPLPYLGRRAGSVQNTIVLPQRQLYDDQSRARAAHDHGDLKQNWKRWT